MSISTLSGPGEPNHALPLAAKLSNFSTHVGIKNGSSNVPLNVSEYVRCGNGKNLPSAYHLNFVRFGL